MSGEKKGHRWRRRPVLIEENLIINSTLSSSTTTTTTTTRRQEEKHTENTRCKWYKNDEDDSITLENLQLTTLLPNETIAEKIDRVLRKINAWTTDPPVTVPPDRHFNPSSNYDNIPRRRYQSSLSKPAYTSLFNSLRRRCLSSTHTEPCKTEVQQHRPYSMTFIDEPLPPPLMNSHMRPTRRAKTFRRQSSFDPSRCSNQRRSMYATNANLTSASSTYGSDFFYPPVSEQDSHEYDNLTFPATNQTDRFPTIVIDCQRCSRSVERSSLRDRSCQVPSDDELYQSIPFEDRKTSRSSPLYVSPRSSPPLCHPPPARTLLAPHHFRRKHSLSSTNSSHNRSKSAPSSSSTTSSISSRQARLPAMDCTVPPTAESNPVPSTTTLLRSIKTSIHAMKKRLKDMRRLSEDSNVTTVLDDYKARSSQELTVSKGQHVRVVQKQLLHAPDWSLIRLLNEHHHHPYHNQSSPSSLTASLAALPSGSVDLSSIPSSKYIEGLVPAVLLKLNKTSWSNSQLPPPFSLSITGSKSEQDNLFNTIDESQPQTPSPAFQSTKRRSSIKRILKTPSRCLSLKDNSTSKDVKSSNLHDLLTTSASIMSMDNTDGLSINKGQPSSSSSIISKESKAFTFTDSDTLTTFPDVTNSISKSIDNDGMNGISKMTESSSSLSHVPRHDFDKDETETFPSPDIQSPVKFFSPTNNEPSSAPFEKASVVRTEINTVVRKLVNTLALESSRSTSGDLSSRLRRVRAPPLTTISPIEDNSVIARLIQHVAPINIVSGFSASGFQIPTALSVTTPIVEEIVTSSVSSSPTSSTVTVIPNDSLTEQTDEISLNDLDQTTFSSITTSDEPVDDRTKYGEKRRHNIIELIETEKEYVKDLALIVEGYMNVIENDKEIKKPTGIIGRERVVFGNVQRIYEFHRDVFLPQLEQSIENPDILDRLFTTNRFNPYVRYCENKPRSEYIVSEYHDYFEEIRKKLGQKLLVSDLLIKPVQRIMRYQLLLREILRTTEKMGDESRSIKNALKVMIDVPQQANDMMNVGRIKDLPTSVHKLGELKLQDMLSVTEPLSSKDTKDIEKKMKERRVFLFQQSMIFCDEIPAKDKYSSPNYIYKYELKINKLQHKEFKQNKELFQFTLVELDAGNSRRVICQCKDDGKYELWVTSVNKVLQRQMDLIIALTNPTLALQKEQDSPLLLFTPPSRQRSSKSASDRTEKSPEISKHSDRTRDVSNRKSPLSFHLFDSILSCSVTKPLTINSTEKKTPTKFSSTSCPPSSFLAHHQLPEQARCLYHYNAIQPDELSVHRGEYVQILSASEDNRWFVRRNATRTLTTVKGWLPGFVLGLKYPKSTTTTANSNNDHLSPSLLSTASVSSNNLHHL